MIAKSHAPIMKKWLCVCMTLCLLLGTLCAIPMQTHADSTLLWVEKTKFEEGEPIMVSAIGSGKDWVGIYTPDGTYSIRWTYIDASIEGAPGSGVPFNIRETDEVNEGVPVDLPAGTYIIRLMPNDTSDISQALAEVTITIEKTVPADIQGDASRLWIEKGVFTEGEPIMVSAIGSGKDWVGIYELNQPHSVRWTYIDAAEAGAPGSGVPFNIRETSEINEGTPIDLPAGTYIIRLMPDDTMDIGLQIAWATIQVLPESGTNAPPAPPKSATYKLDNATDGFSAGTVTVILSEETSNVDVVMYWGNKDGRLPGYTSLAKQKATIGTNYYKLPANTLIPTGATKLLVYTRSTVTNQLSETCIAIDLPQGAAAPDFGKPLMEMQVVSDIHINTNRDHIHNQHFLSMLRDVAALSPDSKGIFVVGDMADHGMAAEYEEMYAMYATVEGVAPLYPAIGNHDLANGSLADQIKLFTDNATLPDGSHPDSAHYDFWMDGYHFIFLGNDQLVGCNTTLSQKTLTWLKACLEENRDPNRPTFVFLHQSLYNTIAGSLPGQGWNGVQEETSLRKILKEFPEVVMFNGHSHWTLDSEKCMYPRDQKLPTIFNTASVAYLWTSYHIVTGEHLDGSQGYYIRLYEDKMLVLGRDFVTGEWIPSAQFYVDLVTKPAEYTVTFDPNWTAGAVTFETFSFKMKAGETNYIPELEGSAIDEATGKQYNLSGWKTQDGTVWDFSQPLTADITLYANWVENISYPGTTEPDTTPVSEPDTTEPVTEAPTGTTEPMTEPATAAPTETTASVTEPATAASTEQGTTAAPSAVSDTENATTNAATGGGCKSALGLPAGGILFALLLSAFAVLCVKRRRWNG